MRIIGYTRLSKEREESTSIARQRELIRRTCELRDLELIDLIEDRDVSATKKRLDRPGLSEVRERIKAGEADAVMVWRLDRLARSVVDFGTLLDEGLQVISATETLDTTTPMGRAMAEILQVFAAMEASTTGVRVSAARKHLRSVGRFPGGRVPYGYRTIPHPDGAGRALEPEPSEARIVRRMVEEVLDGHAVHTVAADLNRDGIRTRRGTSWSRIVIRRMLRSGTLLGRVRVSGTDHDGRSLRNDDFVRDPATQLPLIVWEPLITLEEYERILAVTESTPDPERGDAIRAGRRKASRLLSGLLTCPGCGGTLVVRSRGTRPKFYGCNAPQGACAGGVSVDAEAVEHEVAERFLSIVGDWPVVEVRERRRDPVGLAEIEESIRTTTDAMRAPDADVASLVARLGALRAAREEIKRAPTESTVEHVETGETYAEVWARTDTMHRRQLIADSGAEIAIAYSRPAPGRPRGWDPERVSVTFVDTEASRLRDYVG